MNENKSLKNYPKHVEREEKNQELNGKKKNKNKHIKHGHAESI